MRRYRCAVCGELFVPTKKGQRTCSRACALIFTEKMRAAKEQTLQEELRAKLGIKIPAVYRFVMQNCDYCAKRVGAEGCPSPRANILTMRWGELPKSFREIIALGVCPYAMFEHWDDGCPRYSAGTCSAGIKSCTGCIYNVRERRAAGFVNEETAAHVSILPTAQLSEVEVL